jgi:GT2 family glycosyltransferase
MSTPDQEDQADVSAAALRAVIDRIAGTGNPRVVVIVVMWNSCNHIVDCLYSIQQSSTRVATLVIDNGSLDDSVAVVERRADPDVLLVRAGTNLGYAGGNNLGMSLASTAGAEFIVIVNPDATMDPNCIRALVDVLRSDATVGLASPAICYARSDRLWYAGSEIDPGSAATYHLHEGAPLASLPAEPYETGRASGCALALAPRRLCGIGLLDERYFLYFEEAEWSIRVKEHGLRIVVVPRAVASHDVGHGSGGNNSTYHYYMTRNRLLMASQHGTHGWIGALPGTLRNSIVTLVSLARSQRDAFFPCAQAIVHGYIDFARHRFGQRHN